MNQIAKGSCAQYHANAPAAYFKTVALWKTPVATCDNGKPDCVPYVDWVAAWNTQIK
jgi:putative spermidine/putrescine transport system substrate-binding protein